MITTSKYYLQSILLSHFNVNFCLKRNALSLPDHIGVGQHLPFHRLKLKPVNRLSCVVDYETGGETLKMVERNGSGRENEEEGETVSGSKRI